ncbi:hypothetical protein JYU15_02285 [bacterium AH-315-I18]|nr:hypothetical protein [Phycisphaeraceae bacterium]MBN4061244.1 hypothetical protein [bacterium AH-315-I18]
MATHYWKGHAPAVSQVTTLTPSGTMGSETFTITVGDTSLIYTAGPSDTASVIAIALRDLWNNSAHPYHSSITASQNTDVLSLTATVSGTPFQVTAQATGAATLTVATPTANSGPNDWSTAGNWSNASLPVNADVVIFSNNSVPVLFGLDQSLITLNTLHIEQSYTGKIGLPDELFTVDSNTTDSTQCEYRQTYLAVSADNVHIGQHAGSTTPSGAGRIKLNTGIIQTQLHVHQTASLASDSHHQVVRWVGDHVNNVVRILRGKLGIASNLPGESATISQLYIGQAGSLGSDALVVIGQDVTLTQLNQAGGSVILSCDVDQIQQSAGSLVTLGQALLNTVTLAGQTDFEHIGDITSLTLRSNAQVDFSRQSQARTIGTCKLHNAASLNLNNGNPLSISFTNGIDYVQTSPDQVNITWWPNIRLNVTAIV